MKNRVLRLPALGFLLLLLGAGLAGASTSINLAGQWRFSLEQPDGGSGEQWAVKPLAAQITLPGALQSQGFGDIIATNPPNSIIDT